MSEESNKQSLNPMYIGYFLVGILAIINLLPFLAPILEHFGYHRIANGVYWIYSFTCHQKASRSISLFEEQYGWCMRDTFIWMTMFITAAFVFLGKHNTNGISWKLALILALPMVIDGSVQLIGTALSIYNQATPFYESTNLLRAITGTGFGLAVGMFLFPRMKRELAVSS